MSRTSLVGRPLFVFCSAFFISSLFFAHTSVTNIIISVAVSVLLLLLSLPFLPRFSPRTRILPILLCSAVILSGIFTYFAVTSKISAAAGLDGTVVTGDVTVLDVEHRSEYFSSYTVKFTNPTQTLRGKYPLHLKTETYPAATF